MNYDSIDYALDKMNINFPITDAVATRALDYMYVQEPTPKDILIFREVCKEALKSDDPNTKIGAIVINTYSRIIGRGYTRFPTGMEKLFNWVGHDNGCDAHFTRHPYTIRAEYTAAQEAKLNNNGTLDGCKMYINIECARESFAQLVDEKLKELVIMVQYNIVEYSLLPMAVMCLQSNKTKHPINIRFVKLVVNREV